VLGCTHFLNSLKLTWAGFLRDDRGLEASPLRATYEKWRERRLPVIAPDAPLG
jgi:hypothetical protein